MSQNPYLPAVSPHREHAAIYGYVTVFGRGGSGQNRSFLLLRDFRGPLPIRTNGYEFLDFRLLLKVNESAYCFFTRHRAKNGWSMLMRLPP